MTVWFVIDSNSIKLLRQFLLGFVLIVGFPLLVQVEQWRPWSLFGIAACYLIVMLGKRSLLIACALLGAATGGCAYLLYEILQDTYYAGSIPRVWPWIRNGGAALIYAFSCAAFGAFIGAIGWECLRTSVKRKTRSRILSLQQECQKAP